MEIKNLKPIYAQGGAKITQSTLQDSTHHGSSVAGFNWRKLEYPYMHTHSHWEILLIANGKIKHNINGQSYYASKGDVFLIRPTDYHNVLFEDKIKSETITYGFSDELAQKFFSLYPSLKDIQNPEDNKRFPFVLNTPTFDSIISKTIVTQFLPKNEYEEYSTLIINRLISAYVEQRVTSIETYPDWLNKFLYTLRNPNIFTLTIPEIATYSPYSYQHLALLFKKYTGKTLVEYIKDLKLTYTKEELLYSNKPVNEIALELNYESATTFNNLFKKATGLTPLEYRKNKPVM